MRIGKYRQMAIQEGTYDLGFSQNVPIIQHTAADLGRPRKIPFIVQLCCFCTLWVYLSYCLIEEMG